MMRSPGAPRLVTAVVVAVLLGGCGGSSAPVDDVPALESALARVDDAIVDGRYDDARDELDELVATTSSARRSGDLDGSEADRILAAAAEVMSVLPAEEGGPAEEPEPVEEPEPEPVESTEPAPEDSSGEDTGTDDEAEEESLEEDEKEQEELEKEQEKLEKELEKEAEKEDKGKDE